MKIKKTTIHFWIGLLIMFSMFPFAITPTVDFGDFRQFQSGIVTGLFMTGLLIMIIATINDLFNLNEKKHYFFIMEERNES